MHQRLFVLANPRYRTKELFLIDSMKIDFFYPISMRGRTKRRNSTAIDSVRDQDAIYREHHGGVSQ